MSLQHPRGSGTYQCRTRGYFLTFLLCVSCLCGIGALGSTVIQGMLRISIGSLFRPWSGVEGQIHGAFELAPSRHTHILPFSIRRLSAQPATNLIEGPLYRRWNNLSGSTQLIVPIPWQVAAQASEREGVSPTGSEGESPSWSLDGGARALQEVPWDIGRPFSSRNSAMLRSIPHFCAPPRALSPCSGSAAPCYPPARLRILYRVRLIGFKILQKFT